MCFLGREADKVFKSYNTILGISRIFWNIQYLLLFKTGWNINPSVWGGEAIAGVITREESPNSKGQDAG
jgi:hypothetical protein